MEEEIENIQERLLENSETYTYIKSVAKYYWLEMKTFFSPAQTSNNIRCSSKILDKLREYNIIKDYKNICYLEWGKSGCLNLLDMQHILLPSDNPILDEDIKKLIENVAGQKKENIDYLHKILFYKYLHINDFTIPAIVFYWVGGSWKWSYISLLWTIFWEDNIMWNLWQKDLTWNFDSYKGQRLVVEFAEVVTNNTNSDMKILNKLKNLIWAEKITVNEKGVQVYQIENIAWFFVSSNSNTPVLLDSKDKWNRRFTILRSISKLEDWKWVNESIRNPEKVSNYLSWLEKNYSEVLEYTNIEALDNQDKRDLEDISQNWANDFWDWAEERHPEFYWKKTKSEVSELIDEFCIENDLGEKDFKKYFWKHSKYEWKKIRIWDKTYYWTIIPESKIATVEFAEKLFNEK